ncbi:ABC transporter substrate-binding protein [Paenibacillus glacialis]|uniref:Iron ABC transporter substrate-binding protein n=1 Tax=Paenibacillus glacialis TaxID=494026 RepID=A0A168K3C8_9BACL|nr:ABC transporter substrate-binding protein [Paenibacillus glacialis]OAB41476.1 iron ABC transporter substrate-binding protein [Paenibacillus glacialis]
MKRSVSIMLRLSLFSILLLLCSSCAKETKGTLTIYAGLYEDHAIKAIETFQKQTGIKVSYVRMSSGEILSRIRAEHDNPKASVWFGGPADTFIQAKSEGLLEPYMSPNASMIDPMYRDPDGFWTGIYVGSMAFVSNKTWLQEVGMKAPESWDDLLKPAYRGMISMPDPRSSGTAYTTLATLVQLFGEDEAFKYLKSLHEQNIVYTTSGSVPGRTVGMGEVGTAVMFSHDALKFYKEGFQNLIITFPIEGTGYEIGAVGMIKGGPNNKEAQQFVDWALTKQAQELGKQVGNYQLLTNSNAESPEEAFPLNNLNVISYNLDWAGKNRERLINTWITKIIHVKSAK